MKKWAPLLLSVVLLLIQIMGYLQLRRFPAFVEKWYSMGIYTYISRAMRIGLGWIPFSFGDILYVLIIILVIRWFVIHFKEVVTLSRKRYTQVFTALNIILAFFHFAWGFNYYRQPLNEILELDATYTDEELIRVTQKLVFTANALHEQLQPVDSLKVEFTRSQSELFELAPSGFSNLGAVYPSLDYGPASIKKSLLTLPLTYMGYSGYLNPITGEAQTNGYIDNYKTPVLILHEMSHQLGFAKENEANFIAVLAGMNHDDLYFQYSATIFALGYCLNDLSMKDPLQMELARAAMHYGIIENYQDLRDFWAPYNDNVIEKISQKTYESYLKANNQPDGMRTYSYVVALLVNYYK
ncbi:DUF3810 domain-containing protein [Nonlabens marinus]|uniref:3-deoxy-manno-octulosonate cytidylyltransferase n=1 Tax=Nonlabens marinus S1-08 TaxID=1454201 RepID=W8VXM3_9FLAO|nr:DUF3810 domain-containing protein [Nonlabens marinus]BAO56177.1 hypothetical protein NMS_2168 [Nonlabens marinus S1-08]